MNEPRGAGSRRSAPGCRSCPPRRTGTSACSNESFAPMFTITACASARAWRRPAEVASSGRPRIADRRCRGDRRTAAGEVLDVPLVHARQHLCERDRAALAGGVVGGGVGERRPAEPRGGGVADHDRLHAGERRSWGDRDGARSASDQALEAPDVSQDRRCGDAVTMIARGSGLDEQQAAEDHHRGLLPPVAAPARRSPRGGRSRRARRTGSRRRSTTAIRSRAPTRGSSSLRRGRTAPATCSLRLMSVRIR